jgi:hypothetical protein
VGDPAADAARRVLAVWSSPDVAYQRWWRRLSPLLTPGAREAYRLTDPRRVPRLAPIEFDKLVPGPSDDTATAFFLTRGGRFGVDVTRRDDSSPWRARRVLFPGQESMFG